MLPNFCHLRASLRREYSDNLPVEAYAYRTDLRSVAAPRAVHGRSKESISRLNALLGFTNEWDKHILP